MSDPAAGQSERLVWRLPPYLPAIGLLIVCACAAENIYGSPSLQVRIATLLIGLLILVVSIVALRMGFVVDDEGLAVRFIGRVTWVPWSEVKDIGLADVRGNETIRILRINDSKVDVPPSLLQPVRPTSKLKASRRLRGIVLQIKALDVR